MKVGVLVGFSKQTGGGGYTFERSIEKELLRVSTSHELLIIDLGPNRAGEIDNDSYINISTLEDSIRRNKSKLRTWSRWLRDHLIPRVFRPVLTHVAHKAFPSDVDEASSLTRLEPRPNKVDQVVRTHYVDIVWALSPVHVDVSVPFFTTVWDLQHRLQPWFPEVSLQGWNWDQREKYYRDILPRAAGVVTGTDEGKSEVVRFYGVEPNNVHVIAMPAPGLVDVQESEDGTGAIDKFNIEPGFIFYPAQFWPHKNHVNLIKALKLLESEFGLDLQLVLTGSDKGNYQYIASVAERLKVQQQIHNLGFVDVEDLVMLYQNALCLAFISYFGPDNIPPLEAFELGCPVVAANVPGAEEQLGDAAILVDPSSPLAIANAISQIHNDMALRNMLIEKGRERLEGRTARDYVNGMIRILDDFEPIRANWDVNDLKEKG